MCQFSMQQMLVCQLEEERAQHGRCSGEDADALHPKGHSGFLLEQGDFYRLQQLFGNGEENEADDGHGFGAAG